MKTNRLTVIVASSLIVVAHHPATAETYDSWAATHFTAAQIAAGLASPNGDHDGDACPNIIEYFGGCTPTDPDSALALEFQSDPGLNEVTVTFPFADDRSDIDYVILVSNDLSTWSSEAVFVCGGTTPMYHLNGHRYAKIGVRARPGMMLDSDNDGLRDQFEESLVANDAGDPFQHIGQILPEDDFDGDGTMNIDEEANGTTGTTFTKPLPLDSGLVHCALDHTPPSTPTTLVVHTVLE